MDFISLLKNEYGLDTSKKGKFIKHAGGDCDLRDLWKKDKIALYQLFQSNIHKTIPKNSFITFLFLQSNDKYFILFRAEKFSSNLSSFIKYSILKNLSFFDEK